MKKILVILLTLLVAASIFVSCNRQGASRASTSTAREITVVNGKIEIDAALKAYAAVFERQTGIKVNVRSYGGESPYSTNLTAMWNAGVEPELFVFEGKAGYEEAKNSGRITDLSNEPWVQHTSVAYVDGGKVVGFPVSIEGWGLGYNKEILERAGINPATLTNVNAVRAAFERIDSQKAQLGLTAVVSMAASADMSWVPGNHGTNTYLAGGVAYTDTTYLDMFLRGQVDTTRLTAFAEYMDLLFRFSNRNTLLTGGYDQQVGEFAAGRTAFIHQGNWIDPNMVEYNATFDAGYIPHAFLTTNTDGIFVGAPWYFVVNARSSAQGIADAKQFLTAMATTPEGHNYMVKEAGMIPAFSNVTLTPDGPFSKAVQEYSNAGKVYPWLQNDMPDGFGMNTLGPIYNQLAAGQITVSRFVELFTQAVASIR